MGVKYHMIKNIMIASAGATFYCQSIVNIPKGTVLIGTLCVFAALMILLGDADKHFVRDKTDRHGTCQKKKSA